MNNKKKYSGVIMIADGKKDISEQVYEIKNIKLPEDPVVVLNNFNYNEPIGIGKLSIDGENIFADIDFYPGVKLEKSHSTPCAGILISELEEVEKNETTTYYIKNCILSCVGICFRNIDPRIKPS